MTLLDPKTLNKLVNKILPRMSRLPQIIELVMPVRGSQDIHVRAQVDLQD